MAKTLVIVTGANGKLGKAYLSYFASKEGFDLISMSRSGQDRSIEVLKHINVDLLDQINTSTQIKEIDISRYKQIILVHPVGKFKFQKHGIPEIDNDSDGIDDEVYSSNVITLQNVLTPLISLTKSTQTELCICVFGSITDRYSIPFWSSYSKSKNILRSVLKGLTKQADLGLKIRVLFVNVSSVDTGNENKLRPKADKRFWLKPNEIAVRSGPYLLSAFSDYKEIDIYNPIPDFDLSYYESNEKIFQKWSSEME